ncbi:MAG: tyrosine-protein phosphatase, partial [Bulleidia sp.]
MNEERTMETQSLYLTGVSNARTLAGYRTQDGRAIRPHKLLRTCMLVKATPQDMDILVNQEHL